jgi:two-component system, sensor histidine kinase and response regulator
VPLVTKHRIHEDRRRLRILLAEDNAVHQTLAVRLLEKRGYNVTVVANGRHAVEAVVKQDFDVVLTDIQMPEMDGFEATATIRAKEKLAGTRVPIIAMTAHALKGNEQRCIRAGMDSYGSKPIRSAELFAAIGSLEQTIRISNFWPNARVKQGQSISRRLQIRVAIDQAGRHRKRNRIAS